MKKLGLALLATALMGISVASAQPKMTTLSEHGGGNGGDDLELELKKLSLQIGYFIKSDMGSKVFKMLNPETLLETVNKLDISVVSGNVVDKFGTLRTCVNEPDRSLITCNLKRITEARSKGNLLTAMLFHEILGLLEVELGYQENPSLYPISSKILPYNDIILSTPISEAQIRPEFYGLDSRSYGITMINEKTKETVRMICLNNNIEINRCKNYALVRNANQLQAPLIPTITSLSPKDLSQVKLSAIKPEELSRLESKYSTLAANGFKFLTIKGAYGDQYRFGGGLTQMICDGDAGCIAFLAFWGVPEVDVVIEAGKQSLNVAVFPIKAVINGIKSAKTKAAINKINSKISLAADVMNLSNNLSLVGTSQSVSEQDFNLVIDIIVKNVRANRN